MMSNEAQKEYMDKNDIMKALERLARASGKYARFLYNLLDDCEYRCLVLDNLEAQRFKDTVDLVLYLES